MSKLNAWLRPNLLTEDQSDFVATPVVVGSVGVAEIVAALIKEGMEIKAETAIDIISRFNRKTAEMVASGYSINTGLVLMRPAIKGVFHSKSWDAEKHSVYININQGALLRKEIAQLKVEILGEQSSPMSLFSITDKSTGKSDGTLTVGKNAEIRGTYIKISGDHAENGIYFTNVETQAKVKVEASDIVLNEPSRLLILVPELSAGTYELSVTTQSSTNNTLLKEPRTDILGINIVIS
ncbi:DNA-binding domain-containing protein [Bergeyella porcorum]|uniref:DNA-binding domain-containing protein n=1 Tax=Bergeyella porcorum TaxID=1735111 RepID=UPI0035E7641B